MIFKQTLLKNPFKRGLFVTGLLMAHTQCQLIACHGLHLSSIQNVFWPRIACKGSPNWARRLAFMCFEGAPQKDDTVPVKSHDVLDATLLLATLPGGARIVCFNPPF